MALEVLAEWEAILRQPSEASRLVFQPAMQRQFGKVFALLKHQLEELLALQKNGLYELFMIMRPSTTRTSSLVKISWHAFIPT